MPLYLTPEPKVMGYTKFGMRVGVHQVFTEMVLS